MKKIICLATGAIIMGLINAQNVRFNDNSGVVKVYRGNTINIEVDTAYVIGKIKAEFINQKIDELNEIKAIYNNMVDNHNKLLSDLNTVQELLEKLQDKAINDSLVMSQNFKRLLNELDTSLTELKTNNNHLKKNNSELNDQIANLERIVKQLRKETRGLWWDGVTDKIVAFIGGVGAGMLLMAILK
jgi:septal ring factor EnvC (AmiA/AmiB activator)